MKKLLLTLALVGSVSSAFSQGQVVYYNRVNAANGPFALIYGVEAGVGNETVSKQGNTSAGIIAGTQTYTGALLAGTGFTAGLWAGATADSLTFVTGSLRDFRTGATFSGAINNSGGLIAIPGFGEGSRPFLQIRAWDNVGGTITSWDAAGIRGQSIAFQPPGLGVQAPPPNMEGLTSFNIYVVPEPSTFVLAGLGAAALMFIRRRK